jgi:hypothetical protein
MSMEAKVLRNWTIGGEEPLGLTRRLKPLHASLALAGGLVRVLGTII